MTALGVDYLLVHHLSMIEPVMAPYFPSRILPPLVPGVAALCTHQLNLKFNNSNIFNQPLCTP